MLQIYASYLVVKFHIQVKKSVYVMYFKAMRLINAIGFFGFFLAHYAATVILFLYLKFFITKIQMLRSMWLSDWSNDNTLRVERPSNLTVETRLVVYGAIGGFEGNFYL